VRGATGAGPLERARDASPRGFFPEGIVDRLFQRHRLALGPRRDEGLLAQPRPEAVDCPRGHSEVLRIPLIVAAGGDGRVERVSHTPKHGSWLNIAEVELAVLATQCLDRRLAGTAEVAVEIAAWEARRTAAKATVDWRFTTDQARQKLHRLYPQ
jgi:hypothetical protein